MSRSSVMGGAAAFCLAGTSAFAQVAQQPGGLEGVVVTAQRRAEDLQTVPIALTALSAQALASQGITDTQKLELVTPGLVFSTFNGAGQPYLRGIGADQLSVGGDSAGGNLSALSPPFSVTTLVNDGSDVTAPTQPSSVQAFGYGDLEMQVWWGASTDAVTPQNVIVYEIYVNGVHENTAIGKNMTPSAYGVFGDNVITVIAIDEAGNRSIAGQTTLFIPSARSD